MLAERTQRTLCINGLLVGAAAIGLGVTAHPGATATLLELDHHPWINRLFDIGVVVAFLALNGIAFRMLRYLGRASRRWRATAAGGVPAGESGQLMVEFVLVLPFVLLVMGMIVQLALLANASLVVRYAAFASARSAIVRLDNPLLFERISDPNRREIERTAHLVLSSISPKTGGSDTAAAALERIVGRRYPPGTLQYARRMNYARQATTVGINDAFTSLVPAGEHLLPPHLLKGGAVTPTVPPIAVPGIGNFTIPGLQGLIPPIAIPQPIINAFLAVAGVINQWVPNPFSPKKVTVTVQYEFLVTIPGINLAGLTHKAPAGARGYGALTITRTVTLQSTGARESNLVSMIPINGNTPLFW